MHCIGGMLSNPSANEKNENAPHFERQCALMQPAGPLCQTEKHYGQTSWMHAVLPKQDKAGVL